MHRSIITIINNCLPLPQVTHEYWLVFAAIAKINTPSYLFFFELTCCKDILNLYYQATNHSLVWLILSLIAFLNDPPNTHFFFTPKLQYTPLCLFFSINLNTVLCFLCINSFIFCLKRHNLMISISYNIQTSMNVSIDLQC